MKSIKLILVAVFAIVGLSAMAQDINYDDPKYAKWGANAEERKEMMLAAQFLKEAVDNRNYDLASSYLKQLMEKAPAGSVNIYTSATKLYKNKINRAANEEEKALLVDSLMWVYEKRLENFANHKKYGKSYILDRWAREFLNYKPEDREGIRDIFSKAMDASVDGAGAMNLELCVIYFSNLSDDFQNGLVAADLIIAEYDRLSPAFDKAEGDAVQYKDQFEAIFGASGAASCENLEALFGKKLAATPDDVATLNQAVTLMSRAGCDSDFFFATAEKLYSVKPSSDIAIFLAQGFQKREEYGKALKYLQESLAVESDPAEKEKLYVRMGMINLATKNFADAMAAAKEIKNLNAENGFAYFIMGQCYASSGNCGEFRCQASYWAAYDAMSQAVSLLANDPAIQESAQTMMNHYRAAFPTKEECFFAELTAGARYTIDYGFANGISTTVRYR